MRRFFKLGLVAYVVLAPMAVADVLVLRDGGHLKTAGPWTVEGALVVFTLSSGELSSIRLSAVDLDSSREEVATSIPPVVDRVRAVAPQKPVLVLTNRDIPPAARPPLTRESETSTFPSRKARSKLVVETWAKVEREEIDGVEIVGWLKNRGQTIERVDVVTVYLSDRAGNLVQTAYASLENGLVRPRETTRIRAEFRGVGSEIGQARFKIESANDGHRGVSMEPVSAAPGRR